MSSKVDVLFHEDDFCPFYCPRTFYLQSNVENVVKSGRFISRGCFLPADILLPADVLFSVKCGECRQKWPFITRGRVIARGRFIFSQMWRMSSKVAVYYPRTCYCPRTFYLQSNVENVVKVAKMNTRIF
jgi:hypothetical protein